MIPLYQPPRKYRPRLFSPLGWVVLGMVCVAAVLYGIGLVWLLSAFK